MRKAIFLLVIVLVLTFVSVSQAGGLFCVDVNGPNDPGTGSFDDPFRRIQDAVDVAVSGDIVEIRAGLYTGLGNYDIDPNGKSITIRSIDPNDSNVVANTIIDPNGAGRGFYFDSGEDANCVISGLTIRKAEVFIAITAVLLSQTVLYLVILLELMVVDSFVRTATCRL